MAKQSRQGKSKIHLGCTLAIVAMFITTPSIASEPSEEAIQQARQLYRQGVEMVKQAQWQEALSAFERSDQLRPHATTLFNIGACEQAMGRYTKARETFLRALEAGRATEGELSPSLQQDAQGYLEQIETRLVKVQVTLVPSDASIAVDGRPLVKQEDVYIAGLAPPGPGKPTGVSTFEVVLDPGRQVFTISRRGFSDAVHQQVFNNGDRKNLRLEVEKLPATLVITSDQPDALVFVNGFDAGPVPVELRRPAGMYDVVVKKPGYDNYEASLKANPGEEVSLRALMTKEQTSITSTWWFWTGAAAVVAGGAVLTYALTRPEPSPPPYDGGSSGWVVYPSGFRF